MRLDASKTFVLIIGDETKSKSVGTHAKMKKIVIVDDKRYCEWDYQAVKEAMEQ